jgi:hypothetical protein
MWLGVGTVGAGVSVVPAGRTVLGADGRDAVVVVGQNCCCCAEAGERCWWQLAEAQNMRSHSQMGCRGLVVAPRSGE